MTRWSSRKPQPLYVIRLEFEGGTVRYPRSDCSLAREVDHAHPFMHRPTAERILNVFLTEHKTLEDEVGERFWRGQVIRII